MPLLQTTSWLGCHITRSEHLLVMFWLFVLLQKRDPQLSSCYVWAASERQYGDHLSKLRQAKLPCMLMQYEDCAEQDQIQQCMLVSTIAGGDRHANSLSMLDTLRPQSTCGSRAPCLSLRP